MYHPEILEYSNGMLKIHFIGQEYKFSNSFLKTKYPKYYINEAIKQVYYKPGNDNNAVIYNDGTKEKLDLVDDFYQEIIELSNVISSEYKIKIHLEKSELKREQVIRVTKITPLQLFATDLSEEEQDKLLEDVKDVNPEIVIDNNFFKSKLLTLKKKLLSATDWTQLADVQSTLTEEEKTAWLKYREAIRAIDETDDPKSARLPIPPKDIEL